MDENTKMMLQLANFFAQQQSQQNVSATASTGQQGTIVQQQVSTMAELAKQLLINTANNFIPQLPATSLQQPVMISPPAPSAHSQLQPIQMNTRLEQYNQQQQQQQKQQQQISQVNNIVKMDTSPVSLPLCMNSTTSTSANAANETKRMDSPSLPLVVQAKSRRNREKMKRGPKEKDYFRCFLFCLLDASSKMPKFMSCDPHEQEVVRGYQKLGYGFPAQDFKNGTPQKTCLYLKYTEEELLQFLTALFPVLTGKRFELYRVDRQRNLLRVKRRTPRAIKDTKYQGTVIILPYPDTLKIPLEVVQLGNANFQLTIDNKISKCDIGISDTIFCEENTQSQQSFGTADLSKCPFSGSPAHSPESKSFKNSDSDNKSVFVRFSQAKQIIAVTRNIRIRRSAIVDDLIHLYRYDQEICNYNLCVYFLDDMQTAVSDSPVLTRDLFCTFWKNLLRLHFTGHLEKYPVVSPDNSDDIFEVLGRILSHGLVLSEYWPIQFAEATACFMFTLNCTKELLMKSFRNTLSEFEQMIMDSALTETQLQPPKFSPDLENQLAAFFSRYGCSEIPAPQNINKMVIQIAKASMVLQPYWALTQMMEGIKSSYNSVCTSLTTADISAIYKTLTPEPASLIELVHYERSYDEVTQLLERNVRRLFENYLWSLSRCELQMLLYHWCGADCLCVKAYYIVFSPVAGHISFDKHQCVLNISRKFVTVAELVSKMHKQYLNENF